MIHSYVPRMRKRTVFDYCDAHDFGGGKGAAEIVCEGGPAFGAPCAPRLCRILPGSDYYAEGCTDEEFAVLVADWAVNRKG